MKGSRAGAALRGEINVTPLVDVCLVLLILFLVVTPMLRRHADVSLPKVADPARIPKLEEKITLAVKYPDAATWYENSWLPAAELFEKLKELRGRQADAEILVLADERLSYRDVREAMRVVREAGFRGVELGAARESSRGRR